MMSLHAHGDEARRETYVCLDFRREKLADPKRLSEAAHEHLAGCVLCQAFARRTDRIEAAVAETLRIPLPEGMNERILLKARSGQKTAWRAMALAATVIISVAVSLSIGVGTQRHDSMQLALAAAAHAADESTELHSHRSLEAAQLGLVLANFGGTLQEPLGQVRYIHFCPIEGFGMGWHIAYETSQGKVTLLLIPGQHGGAATQTVEVEGRQVRVHRAGEGYYAVITDSMTGLEAADRDLRTKVRWRS